MSGLGFAGEDPAWTAAYTSAAHGVAYAAAVADKSIDLTDLVRTSVGFCEAFADATMVRLAEREAARLVKRKAEIVAMAEQVCRQRTYVDSGGRIWTVLSVKHSTAMALLRGANSRDDDVAVSLIALASGDAWCKPTPQPGEQPPLPALPDGIADALDDYDDARYERGHDAGRGAKATEKERNESKAAAQAARTVLENRIRRALAK